MTEGKRISLGFAIVLVVLFALCVFAFNCKDVFGADHPLHLPGSYMNNVNNPGVNADSVIAHAYYGKTYQGRFYFSQADSGVNFWYFDTTVDKAGYWRFDYEFHTPDGDTLQGSEKVLVVDTMTVSNDGMQGLITDSSSVGCGGSGLQTDSIFVLDTSGTPAVVNAVGVTIKNSGQTADIAWGSQTNANGYVVYSLDVSTTYNAVCFRPGYAFDVYSFTTGSGATHNDTVKCRDIEIGEAGLAGLKRVYDYIYTGDADTLSCRGIVITAELVMPTGSGVVTYLPYDSATGVIITNPKPTYTNSSCLFTFDLFPNDGASNTIKPDGTRWHFTAKRFGRIIYDQIVSLSGTTTEQISAIHRSQQD